MKKQISMYKNLLAVNSSLLQQIWNNQKIKIPLSDSQANNYYDVITFGQAFICTMQYSTS